MSFWRSNPEFGELTKEHGDDFFPVQSAMEILLKDFVMPNAMRDDRAEFRQQAMKDAALLETLEEYKPKLKEWMDTLPKSDSADKDGINLQTWIDTLTNLNTIGTFECLQGSDIVGDARAGTKLSCRLSLPQVKSEFVDSQKNIRHIGR